MPEDTAGASVPYTGLTPEAFFAWLHRTVPMVTYDSPRMVTIGGLPGLQALSTTRVGQIIAACKGAWWVDLAPTDDLANHLVLAENPGAERLSVLEVGNRTVLIETAIGSNGATTTEASAYFPRFSAVVDQALATIRWPNAG